MYVEPVSGQHVRYVAPEAAQPNLAHDPQLGGKRQNVATLDSLTEHVQAVSDPSPPGNRQDPKQVAMVLDRLQVADAHQIAARWHRMSRDGPHEVRDDHIWYACGLRHPSVQ